VTVPEGAGSGGPEQPTFRGETSDHGPPDLDAVALGRVVSVIEIVSVDLVALVFEQADIGALPASTTDTSTDNVGLSVEWEYDESRGLLGCVVNFGVDLEESMSDDAGSRVKLRARFRLVYRVGESGLSATDFDQFAHWNAVFNAWPYWREVAQSTLARAGLDPLVMPVFRMPRAEEPTAGAPSEADPGTVP